MSSAHLVRFCLAVIGAYGILYAVHAGRSAEDTINDLDSRISENESNISTLEDRIESVESTVSDLERNRY